MGWFDNSGFQFATSDTETTRTIVDFETDELGLIVTDPVTLQPIPIFGPDVTVSGFRLRAGRASYGIGLETFAIGFPIHFDWSWKTLFNKQWEDILFADRGGSAVFREPRFAMWIGYDF